MYTGTVVVRRARLSGLVGRAGRVSFYSDHLRGSRTKDGTDTFGPVGEFTLTEYRRETINLADRSETDAARVATVAVIVR